MKSQLEGPQRSLRIAMVLPNLDVGGMESLTIALAHRLRAFGHDVQFLLTQSAGSQQEMVSAAGFAVTVLPLLGKRPIWGSRRLRDWLRAARLDVLHTHSGDWVKVAPVARSLSKLRIIHTQHGEAERDVPSRVLRWRAARNTDLFIAVSDNVVRQLREETRVPSSRIAVVPNGVDTALFRPGDTNERDLARQLMGISPDTQLVLGMIARMDPAKNHAMVLRAFARVRDRLPDCQLVLIGNGPLEHSVCRASAALGEGAVRFLGARADVPALLVGIDLVILGSRTEGTSMTLLEAMAAGKPCVATDVGGTRALFDGRFGVLVPNDDEAALADAVIELAMDARRRTSMGASARQHVIARYSLEVLARKHEQLYRGSTVSSHER